MMTADQVRMACQADAFLTHMVNERFQDLGHRAQWHVGFHPKPEGVEMHLGLKVNAESFMVRRPFPPLTSTSGIYYGCVEMIDTLRKSVDTIIPPNTCGCKFCQARSQPDWPKHEGVCPECVYPRDHVLCSCGSGYCHDHCDCRECTASFDPTDLKESYHGSAQEAEDLEAFAEPYEDWEPQDEDSYLDDPRDNSNF